MLPEPVTTTATVATIAANSLTVAHFGRKVAKTIPLKGLFLESILQDMNDRMAKIMDLLKQFRTYIGQPDSPSTSDPGCSPGTNTTSIVPFSQELATYKKLLKAYDEYRADLDLIINSQKQSRRSKLRDLFKKISHEIIALQENIRELGHEVKQQSRKAEETMNRRGIDADMRSNDLALAAVGKDRPRLEALPPPEQYMEVYKIGLQFFPELKARNFTSEACKSLQSGSPLHRQSPSPDLTPEPTPEPSAPCDQTSSARSSVSTQGYEYPPKAHRTIIKAGPEDAPCVQNVRAHPDGGNISETPGSNPFEDPQGSTDPMPVEGPRDDCPTSQP
ncbi:hypothetical protein V5O48_011424 [Marasmius crinis-equi]|uniref:Uncharacterized protein n=1 Tax=Marasmius crinis-equi TaxID=585013 RepID=A0ABR3F5N3_9AGAR